MNIPMYILDKLQQHHRFLGWYLVSALSDLLIGLIHLFPPCCIMEFTLNSLCEYFIPDRWRGWLYNEERSLQYCLFHSRKKSRIPGVRNLRDMSELSAYIFLHDKNLSGCLMRQVHDLSNDRVEPKRLRKLIKEWFYEKKYLHVVPLRKEEKINPQTVLQKR
jgi:hypothetical protein